MEQTTMETEQIAEDTGIRDLATARLSAGDSCPSCGVGTVEDGGDRLRCGRCPWTASRAVVGAFLVHVEDARAPARCPACGLPALWMTAGRAAPHVRSVRCCLIVDGERCPGRARVWLRASGPFAGARPVNETKGVVLPVLENAPAHGYTASEIARATGLTLGSVAGALNRYARRGYAVRSRERVMGPIGTAHTFRLGDRGRLWLAWWREQPAPEIEVEPERPPLARPAPVPLPVPTIRPVANGQGR